MIPWENRSHEERHLLNPAFCSIIIWHACRGAENQAATNRKQLSFIEAFLVLPIILHKASRESLPSTVRTSLPVWINTQPEIIATLPQRAQSLTLHTKEAVTFGSSLNLLEIIDDELVADSSLTAEIRKTLKSSTPEVKECMKKAEFLGKWFTHTGPAKTIYTLLGVRP